MVNSLIKLMKTYSFVIRRNKSADILLLDDDFAKLRLENFSATKINLREINLYYFIPQLLKSFLKRSGKSQLKKSYLIKLFGSFNSKIAIGHNVTGWVFIYKECFPENVAINYQFGRVTENDLCEFFFYEKGKFLQCDYFFVYNEAQANVFSKIIKSKYIISGYLKNNEIILKSKAKKFDILLISEYDDSVLKSSYYSVCYEFVVTLLGDYCRLNNKSLCIALRSQRPDKVNKISREGEIRYFRQFADFVTHDKCDSYELAAASNLSVLISSNLGNELLSRKMKVLFLPIHALLVERWEINREFMDGVEGPFWYKGFDKEIIRNKIKNLLEMSDNVWYQTLSLFGEPVKFDQGNTILKNLLEDILDTKKKQNDELH